MAMGTTMIFDLKVQVDMLENASAKSGTYTTGSDTTSFLPGEAFRVV